MRNVRNRLVLAIGLVFAANIAFGQAKKPTLMVVPSDVWCNKNGFMKEYDNGGTVVKIPDYKRALQESTDLINAISKINGLMAERGFPLKNLETVLKTLEEEAAVDANLTSKEGAGISETPLDKLKKRAKADIIIQMTYVLNQTGPKKSITFNLQGLDSYTSKQVATAQGTGAPTLTAELIVLLEEAVVSHMDNFTGTLQEHFEDMFANGREITIRIKTFDSWEHDLESEFDGEELSFLIEDWMDEHTVQGRYNTSDVTESMMLFEQVRIPMYDSRGRAMDSRRFARDLYKYLKAEPIEVTSKLIVKGLGQATIILGAQ